MNTKIADDAKLKELSDAKEVLAIDIAELKQIRKDLKETINRKRDIIQEIDLLFKLKEICQSIKNY